VGRVPARAFGAARDVASIRRRLRSDRRWAGVRYMPVLRGAALASSAALAHR
jgi:hypothetical protein